MKQCIFFSPLNLCMIFFFLDLADEIKTIIFCEKKIEINDWDSNYQFKTLIIS